MTNLNIEPKIERERETNTVVVDRRDGGSLAIIGVVVAVLIVLGIGYFWMTSSQNSSVNVNITEESVDAAPVQTAPEQPAPKTVTPEQATPAPVAPQAVAPEQAPPAAQ